MDDSYISLRREKIQKARECFSSTSNPNDIHSKGIQQPESSQEVLISFTKFKIFISILLFSGFLVLHFTETEIKGIGSQTISTYIETNMQTENLLNKIESLISNNF